MENKLIFDDGVTWEYEWTKYYIDDNSWFYIADITDPIAQNTKYPYRISGAPTSKHLYFFDSYQLVSSASILFNNMRMVSTSSDLTDKYWVLCDLNNYEGDKEFMFGNLTGYLDGTSACWGYGGQEITLESTGSSSSPTTTVRVVEREIPYKLCDFTIYSFSYTVERNQNKNAHPANGPETNDDWFILTKYPDNVTLTNSDLYGGVNYEHVLNSDENIRFGQVATARIDFETYALDVSFVGRTCKYQVRQKNDGNTWRQIGVFYVVKAERLNTNGRYRIIAYDNTYKLNTIIDDWLYHTDCYANRYEAFDSDLPSYGGSTITIYNDWSGSDIILCTNLKVEYTPSPTWNSDIWKFKRVAETEVLTIPHYMDSETDSRIATCNAWLAAHAGQPIFEVGYWDGDYARLNAFNIYSSAQITLGSSYSTWVQCQYCRRTTKPYRVWHSEGTYFDDWGPVGPFYESTDTESLSTISSMYGHSNTYALNANTLHRAPIISNNQAKPIDVLNSICTDLGLTSGGISSIIPLQNSDRVYFGFTASNITASLMLGYLAELYCGWVCANTNGQIYIDTWGYAVSKFLDNTQYKKYNFSDEMVNYSQYVELTIKQTESDVGVSYTSNNPQSYTIEPRSKYVMVKNPWTINAPTALQNRNAQIFISVFERMHSYYPATVDCLEDYDIKIGNLIKMDNGTNNVFSYVFSKRMNIGGVTFESTGNNDTEETKVATIEVQNELSGKAVNLQTYDYDNDNTASINIDGQTGNIYITTGPNGHVYINGNPIA